MLNHVTNSTHSGLDTYLAGRDGLAALAGRQAAQHFEVLQQQQETSDCRLPAIELAGKESHHERIIVWG